MRTRAENAPFRMPIDAGSASTGPSPSDAPSPSGPVTPDATTTAELYCAAAGGACGAVANAFVSTGSTAMGRIAHTATLLQDGTVLIAGGNVSGVSDATAEIYCTAETGPVALDALATFAAAVAAPASA